MLNGDEKIQSWGVAPGMTVGDVHEYSRARMDGRYSPLTPSGLRDGRSDFKRMLSELDAYRGKLGWVGDSITEQGKPSIGTGAGQGIGYTTFIEQAYPNIQYTNFAIGGKTTLNVLNDSGWLASMVAANCDVYVIAIGVNDARYNDTRGATTQAAYIANMTSIIGALTANGAKVVVISIWPTYWMDQFSALGRKSTDDRMVQWNNALQSACKSTWSCPFIDAYRVIRSAITYQNVQPLIPDGVHPDYAGTTAKKLYANAVLNGSVSPGEFAPDFVPLGTYAFKVRVFDNGQADHTCSIKNFRPLPYYKDRLAMSADGTVTDPLGMFGSYQAGYGGYRNKAQDFPFEFIFTTDQWPQGALTIANGALRGIRAHEVYLLTVGELQGFGDVDYAKWRLISSEYSNTAVMFDLLPAKRNRVFYKVDFLDSTGTDGTGGTTGQYIKIAKIWPGMNPVRYAFNNFVTASIGAWERADLYFSATGGNTSAYCINTNNGWPFSVMFEAPFDVSSLVLASVNDPADSGAAARNIKNFTVSKSYDPACMGIASHSSWSQKATGVGDQTVTLS